MGNSIYWSEQSIYEGSNKHLFELSHITLYCQFYSQDLDVSGSESFKDRSKLLDISAELQVSFLSGLATVGVAGNFLM